MLQDENITDAQVPSDVRFHDLAIYKQSKTKSEDFIGPG